MMCICTENIDEFDLKSKFKFIAGLQKNTVF